MDFKKWLPAILLILTCLGRAEDLSVASSDSWRCVPNTSFQSPEKFTYTIHWGLITAGRSSLSVQAIDVVNGRPAYHLVSDARSAGLVEAIYKVTDRDDTWLDEESLVTVRYEKRIHEGRYHIEETVLLDQLRHTFTDHAYRFDKQLYEDAAGSITLHVLDILGSLYYVRTLPLEVGASYTMDVFSGKKVWPLVVKIRKREMVSVPAGKFDCFLVEPLLREPGIFVSKGKKLEVWMTADERRMPVRMRSEVTIGHVTADLISYHPVVEPPAGTHP